jgi:hydrogenase maturation protease
MHDSTSLGAFFAWDGTKHSRRQCKAAARLLSEFTIQSELSCILTAINFSEQKIDRGQYDRRIDMVHSRRRRWSGIVSIEVMRRQPKGHAVDEVSYTSPSANRDIVMLGIGNVLLGDDSVGIKLVERLRNERSFPLATFIDGGTLGFGLLGFIETTGALLVADAAELEEAPGTVRLFEDEEMDRFLTSSRRRSVHEVGLCDLLDMARLLECMPKRRALLCVQPCTIDWTEQLSGPVASTFDAAARQAGAVLRNWCDP